MNEIVVNASTRYSIYTGYDLLQNTGNLVQKATKAKQIALVSDDTVAPLYARTVTDSLQAAGYTVVCYVIPHGEASKSLHQLGELYEFLCAHKITRKDALVALGGGVVGDLTGFCAATYMRGIDYIQIPTTFLAQIDSSVGGKTAVNIEGGKNLVGSFKQPNLVICDIGTLSTLSKEHFADGVAEAIKYGMIKDSSIFETIEDGALSEHLETVIRRCIEIKKEVVERDEFDTGERMLLNFGHTFGHAIEKYYHYSTYSHGMGVAAGMAKITALSERYNLTETGTTARLVSCIQRCGLPIDAEIDNGPLIEYSLMDKKASADSISIVLVRKIGDSFVAKLSREDYIRFVQGSYQL
ncbi:MAG: 3-dehydroquinate synthase [Oscillospiraceae bacterium]|jgi:3-dehydroquinate synthase